MPQVRLEDLANAEEILFFDGSTIDGRTVASTASVFAANAAFAGAFVAHIGNASGANDTASIQSALTAARSAGGGVVRGRPGQDYQINDKLIIGSGTTFDLTGCTITMSTSSGPGLVTYASQNPQRTVTDAAITAGDTTLTSATAAFTSADVGRTVNIAGAAAEGDPLTGTIVSVTNGTTVEIDLAAGSTVSGASCPIYTRDHDIEVIGGSWIRDSTSSNDQFLKPRFVDRIAFRRLHVETNHGKYAINPAAVTDCTIEDITFDTFSDGIHVMGPARNVHIRNIHGTTGDDFVAIIPYDWPDYADVVGSIVGVDVEGLYPTASTAVITPNGLKVLGGSGVECRAITARGLYGSIPAYPIFIGDDATEPQTVGRVDELTVTDVHTISTVGYSKAILRGADIGRVRLDQMSHVADVFDSSAVEVEAGAVVDSLTLDGLRCRAMQSNSPVLVAGTVVDLNVNDGAVEMTDAGWFATVTTDGDITRFNIDGVHVVGSTGGGFVSAYVGTPVIGALTISRSSMSGSPAWIGAFICSTDVTLRDSQFAATSGHFYIPAAGGQVRLRGGGCTFAAETVGSITGGAVRLLSFDIPVDLSTAGISKTAGDRALNVNAGLSCGAGPATSNGTNWKGLYSGATY